MCKKDADLRFCKKHPMELFNGTTISIKLDVGTTKRFPVEAFEAPVPSGGKGFRSPTKKIGKGIGIDRMMYRHINEIKENSDLGVAFQQVQEIQDI